MTTQAERPTLRDRVREFREHLRDEQHGQMARAFAKSMLLLGAAMMSALYASSSAREGHVVTAALGAVIAMSIALWVGIRFVPRLAAGVDWHWLPFFTQYTLTRDGWIYIGASIVVTSAAVNTGNNLLYMVLSVMLAVMVLSGVLSNLNFRFLRITARLPDHCFALEPFHMALSIHNPKQFFPTLSITVQAPDASPFEFAPFYTALVQTRSESRRTVTTTLHRRGYFEVQEVHVQSRYPFGFMLKGRNFPVEGRVVAFPEILPADRLTVSVRDILGTSERFERGSGMDLYLIREYEPSDSARHVDWKASAKTAQLKTREFAAEESRRVVLVFDRYGAPSDVGLFEHQVSEAASLAVHLVEEGAEVALQSDDWTSPSAKTPTQVEEILRYLALVEMSPTAAAPPAEGPGECVQFSLRAPSGRLQSE